MVRKFPKLSPARVLELAETLTSRANRISPQQLPGTKELETPEVREAIQQISG